MRLQPPPPSIPHFEPVNHANAEGCPNKPTGSGPMAEMPALSAVQIASEDFRKHAMHGSIQGVLDAAPKADCHEVEASTRRSALHKAAFWNHVSVVKFLVDVCKIDPTLQDANGDTALHDAARFGHLETIQILAPISDLSATNLQGLTCESVARLRGKTEVLHLLRPAASRSVALAAAAACVVLFLSLRSGLFKSRTSP